MGKQHSTQPFDRVLLLDPLDVLAAGPQQLDRPIAVANPDCVGQGTDRFAEPV